MFNRLTFLSKKDVCVFYLELVSVVYLEFVIFVASKWP